MTPFNGITLYNNISGEKKFRNTNIFIFFSMVSHYSDGEDVFFFLAVSFTSVIIQWQNQVYLDSGSINFF